MSNDHFSVPTQQPTLADFVCVAAGFYALTCPAGHRFEVKLHPGQRVEGCPACSGLNIYARSHTDLKAALFAQLNRDSESGKQHQ